MTQKYEWKFLNENFPLTNYDLNHVGIKITYMIPAVDVNKHNHREQHLQFLWRFFSGPWKTENRFNEAAEVI